ncbi:uncharacterized protein TNCV_5036231 [Trichonephila clavipes]|nr:uncharacterized protein TNCV_5036231 [Trichonephila clavipes]
MDPIDAFPEHLSTTVVPVTLPDKPEALDYAARQGQVRAGIIYQEPTAKRLIQKGFHVGDFWKMKKFNQTSYKLPPPTPIHVPVEKRPLEEKSLPKKRVRITPVMRRVSRRSERPMASVQIPQPPVQIPDVLEPVQIPLVPQSPVQIPDVLEPVPIPDVLEPVPISDVPPSPVHIPQPPDQIPDVLEPFHLCRFQMFQPVQIPDDPEPVQIPVSHVPQPPMQILPEPMNILHVSEPVQIPDDPEPVQIPVSQVPQPPMQILPEPMNILHVSKPVQIEVLHVPPMQILHVSEPVQIPLSQVPPMQILHVSEPVQIPVSQVPQSPVQIPPVQLLPELDILDPLESTDAFDQLMSFVFGPQELQLLHTVPSIFDGNLFSFLDEFEREPMDLTMPRQNSCVKKFIGFKPIQPMDLSVNSCL